MKLHKQMTLGATSLTLLLAGCATTTFTSIWKAPDAQPLQFKAGDKVVAMVIADSTGMRRRLPARPSPSSGSAARVTPTR